MKPQLLRALCAVMLLAANAAAAPAHVHGLATLDVAIDGEALELNLDSPLANLVGFEHAPADAKEIQAIRDMARQFSRPEALFAPSLAALCSVKSVQLSSAALDAKLLAAAGVSAPPPNAADHDEDGHADLDARIVFRCERPQDLKRLEAKIFDAFPGMVQLDVQVVTPRRQSAAKLTANSNGLDL
jgi:Protein of unknown function (DUF2796)